MTKIEKPIISVNKSGIKLSLCLTEYYNAKIYKLINGNKTLIYDTKNNKNYFIDKNVDKSDFNEYVIVPYYTDGTKIYYGKEIILEKIKSPKLNFGDWWENDFE